MLTVRPIAAAVLFLGAVAGLPCRAEMRVTNNEAMRAAVKKVSPEYNPVARQMRVQGDVEVEASISEAGEVTAVKVVLGNSLLTGPVVKAVREWRFQPFVENGKPAAALATLRFSFKI